MSYSNISIKITFVTSIVYHDIDAVASLGVQVSLYQGYTTDNELF